MNYKVKIGENIWDNLSLETLTNWVMLNKLQPTDQVAVMNSESWVPAKFLPPLKPAFVARDTQEIKAAPSAPDVAPTISAPVSKPHPQDKYLLKLKIKDYIWDNLTPEQISDYIVAGKVQPDDLVAAMNSENWTAAKLVPALKPAFAQK